MLLAALAVAAAVCWLTTRSRRATAVTALAGVALVGLLDSPIDALAPIAQAERNGTTVYPTTGRGTTPALLEGLTWVRDHTPADAVLAVNNHYIDDEGTDPREFQYAAFSERRVAIQSWAYTPEAFAVGLDRVFEGALPFPRLTRLNDAVFARADRRALAELRRDPGVDFLLADRRFAGPGTDLASLGRVAFANRAVQVIDVRAPAAS